MQQFILDLKDITNEAKSMQVVGILLQSVNENSQFNKQMARDFLTKCLYNLEDTKSSPQLKFYTLSIIKNFDNKDKTIVKIFSLLSGHPLFTYLIQSARKVDPRKSITQKGKNLFTGNKQLGVKFIRLILESLKIWSDRFPVNSKQQPTKYRKSYTLLIQQKITFPNQYIFYDTEGIQRKNQQKNKSSSNKNQQKKQTQKSKTKVSKQEKQKQTPQGSLNLNQKQIAGQIRFLYNKIQIFVSIIEQQQDIDQLYKEIIQSHSLFEKQQKKLQNVNIFQGQQQQIVNLYLNINEFLNQQKNIFNQEIAKNQDLKSYCERIIIQFEKIFTQEKSKRDNIRKSQKPSEKIKQKQKQKNKSQINQKTQKNNYQKPQKSINKLGQLEQKQKYQSKNIQKSTKNQNDQQQQQDEETSLNNNRGKNKQNNGLKGFFDRHLQKPSKSIQGFKRIRQSIQLQRSKNKPTNSRASKSPFTASNMSRSKYQGYTVSKLKTDGIFTCPPNSNPIPKNYQGQIIPFNLQLQSSLDLLNKNQGMRRFKISNLKNRSLLYESQHIQIGYKNQTIYDEVKQFQEIIQFELFIGNKSPNVINDLIINFQGDQRSLVYTNPQKTPSIINPGEQYKFQIVIIPRHQVYGLTSMCLSYKFGRGSQISSSCILPASIMKFCSYIRSDAGELKSLQNTFSKHCFQSDRFKLSHYLAPKKLGNYMQQLVQMTSYSEFCENGSQTDFVVSTYILLKQRYEAVLKINIRPNLNVIIQIKTNQQSQQGLKSMKLYIQTLSMVLRQIR